MTQIGIFNRCSCYTQWGRTGLALPERPDVAATLFSRLKKHYFAITFVCISIELMVIPLFICFRYQDGLRVFIQRDDCKSNALWYWKAHHKLAAMKDHIHSLYVQHWWTRSKPSRSGTSAVEQGLVDEPIEIQTLTDTMYEGPEHVVTEEANPEQSRQNLIKSNPLADSSSIDPPSRSGTNMLSGSEPRRRDTQQWRSPGDEAPRSHQFKDKKVVNRKPLPTASPNRGFGPDTT